ncbi:MAG: hypothetical protein ACUVXA_17350 [Candidatus Jordarchaeum sp.]|uniref:hypothetical protein n=1 Tax=Candidatus Jordarchaeum sp. TaxID=2823881 RepID=UPI00404AA434
MIANFSKDLYSIDDGFSKQTEREFKEYKFHQFVDAIQWSTVSLSKFVYFLDMYFKAMTLWFDFFYNIADSLGVKEHSNIFIRKKNLEDIIEPQKIDLGFLKYNISSTLDFVSPKIKDLFTLLLSELKELPDILKILRSEIAEHFVSDLEETIKKWLNLDNEFHVLFEEALKDSSHKCINKLLNLFENLKKFAESFLRITGYLTPSDKIGVEYEFKDFLKILDTFNEIQKDLKILLDVRREAYEHSEKFTELIPAALWGDKETALKKFESFVRFEIPTDELIPKNIQVEDLAFNLIQARTELNVVDQAVKLEKEKVHVLKWAAELLKSQIFQILYEGIQKRAETARKYLDMLYQNLDELQAETQKVLKFKSKKPSHYF